MTADPTITIDQLRHFALAYDRQYGAFPESQYEGESVLAFVRAQMGLTPPGGRNWSRDHDEWEAALRQWSERSDGITP